MNIIINVVKAGTLNPLPNLLADTGLGITTLLLGLLAILTIGYTLHRYQVLKNLSISKTTSFIFALVLTLTLTNTIGANTIGGGGIKS